jgi:hypothetical protein
MPADSTVTDRVFVIDPNEKSRARTNDVFEKRVREGTLLQMAPFVILTAARSVEDLPRTGKVILSIDRDRHNCFQVIFSDDIVIKQNIYPEGRKKLVQMHDNICEMGSRGIRVIKEELSDTGISMDNFGPDNLLAFLEKHPERTEEMLDMILNDVLNSSDTFTDAGKLILKKGYTDMTPFNCYYDGTRLVYFDQEFTKEDCPVSYVMFRAVKYLYIHIEGLEQFVKQSYLYDKYSITEDLESFEVMEYRFVSSLRRMDVFSQFWNWRT